MNTFYMNLLQSLGARGAQDIGYATEHQDALLWLSPPPEGDKPLVLAITCKSATGDIPAPPPAFQELIREQMMAIDKQRGTIAISLPGDIDLDQTLFLQNLDYYLLQLKEGDYLPRPRCSGCMESKNLEVVPDGNRAVRICPDCDRRRIDRLRKEGSTSVISGGADAADEEDDPRVISPIRGHVAARDGGGSRVGVGGLLGLVTLIFLPITTIFSGALWTICWEIFYLIAAKFAGEDATEISAPWIVWFIIGVIIGLITALPVGLNIRVSGIGRWVPPVVPAVIFGALAIVLGECFNTIMLYKASTGNWNFLAALAVLQYWKDQGTDIIFTIIFAGLAIYCCYFISDPSAELNAD